MTPLMQQMESVSGGILKLSLEASILIVTLLFLRWLLRERFSARLRYSLWMLVWIKLSLPWLPESVTSVYGLWGAMAGVVESQTISNAHDPLDFSSSNGGQSVNTTATFPSAPMQESDKVSSSELTVDSNLIRNDQISEESNFTHTQMASVAWVLGVLGMGLVMMRNMLALRRRVLELSGDLPENLKDQFVQSMQARGIKKNVSLRVTGAVDSPALYGVFRPVILLPKGAMNRYSENELRLVWLHELEHLMRRDHWVNVWTSMLLVLHWFNPFVWFAVKRMRSDREFAVDEAVLRQSNADAETYGESILKTMDRVLGQKMQPGIIGILEDKTALKERFERIAKFDVGKPESKGIWVLVLLLLISFFLSHPIQSDDEVPKENSVSQVENPNDNEALNRAVHVLERSTNAFGSKGRIFTAPEKIESQLKSIIIDEVHFMNEPFEKVLEWLYEECLSKKTFPNHVNFVATAYKEEFNGKEFAIDLSHMMKSRVTIDPPMMNANAWDVCHRIAEVMTIPVKIRVVSYAVIFNYDFFESDPIFQKRSYKLPDTETMILKAREILNISPEEELSASEALLRVFEAAGISFVSSIEDDETMDSILNPIQESHHGSPPPVRVTNSRGLYYNPEPGLLMVSAPQYVLDQVDRIVDALAHVPTQVAVNVECGHLTQLVKKDAVRHTLLRPLGKEVLDRPSARSSTISQYLLTSEEKVSYLSALNKIQSVKRTSPMSFTTLSLRPAALHIQLEKEENQAPQVFASGPANMKVEVYPAVNEQTDLTRDTYVGVQAILPGWSSEGQFVMFPDGSQFPEIHGASAIPKGHTLLIHYSRRKAKGDPWERTNEEWLQEFVILVTPTLIDPAGNRID